MAIININGVSTSKDGKFVEGGKNGNVRRKFLVTVNTFDSDNIVPQFAEGVQKATVMWLPLVQNVTVTDPVTGIKSVKVTHPAEQLTTALAKLKGTGRRVQMHATIARLIMDEPTPGQNDLVWQTMTAQIDDNKPKRFDVVEATEYEFASELA